MHPAPNADEPRRPIATALLLRNIPLQRLVRGTPQLPHPGTASQ